MSAVLEFLHAHSAALTIGGLFLDIVGVLVLAVDVIKTHRYARESLRRLLEIRKLQMARDAQFQTNLDDKPSQAIAEQFVRDINYEFNPQIAAVWKEDKQALEHLPRALKWVWWGVALLVLGFLLQLLANLPAAITDLENVIAPDIFRAIETVRPSDGFASDEAASPMSTTATLVAFSDALAALGIDPQDVEVSLAVADWKALDKQLAKEHADGLFESISATGGITLRGVRCFR